MIHMSRKKREIPVSIATAIATKGGRMTNARKDIILYLQQSKTPQSIQEIVLSVHADEASVYRTIALLKSFSLVEEIILSQGQRKYSLAHEHHHHIVCSECGFVVHVPCRDSVVHTKLKDPRFTTITDHSITYYGTCTTCVR